MKHSNVVEGKYSVHIYDGLELICKNDNFETAEEAAASAARIVESQKQINGPSDSTYAYVWGGKKMLYYFD